MIRSNTYTALAAAILFSQLSSAAITKCPNEEAVWETPIGVKYTVCPGSDYQYGGNSLQVVKDVASTKDCVQICDTDARCYRAVYDTEDKLCHVKDNKNNMNWAADGRFVSIRMTNDLPEGSFLATCPFDEESYKVPNTDKEFRVCLNTDYTGTSVKMVKGVTTVQACAELCSNTKDCTKSVHDNINNVCHIKGAEPANSLFWVQDKQFTTIHIPETYNPAVEGKWGDLIRLPVIPVAAYIVPAYPQPDRLLFFSSWGKDAFGGASGMTQYGDYNFATGEISQRTVTNTHHDMFCPGISQLQDGRIVVQGGSDAEAVSIYDPATNNFTRGPDMKIARGYQTSTTLSNGKIFTIGGAYSGPREGKNGEMYDPETNEWTLLNGANVKPMLTVDHEGIWREDNHAWLFGWKNGSVYQAGPSKDQHWYGTDGDGSVMKAATRDDQNAMCGVWVMYDAVAGKILSAGGSPDYTDSVANNHAHITTIGEPNTPAEVERVADMAFPRGFANAVVLPDGQVLVTGGQRKSLVFTNTDGILIAELFNPETKEWKQMAPMAVPRNYHSVSILMPDATVFSGGGGLCYVQTILGSTAKCDKTVDHADGEIFQPPYLFNADGTLAARPVAVRAAHALGIHKRDNSSLFPIHEQETRERLWKALRVLDLFLAASLGRPLATTESRDFSSTDNHSASLELCSIFESILNDVYAKRMVTTDTLERISEQHRRWAARFSDGLAADGVKSGMYVEAEDGEKYPNVGLYHMKEAYYWSIMLLSRPFLIDFVSRNMARSQNMSTWHDEPQLSSSSDQLLVHACVDSAIRTIDLLSGLITDKNVSKRHPFVINSVFVSALVLGLAVFGDLDSTFPLDKSLADAQALLRRFSKHDPVANRELSIVEHLQGACVLYTERRARRKMECQGMLIGELFGSVHDGASLSNDTSRMGSASFGRESRMFGGQRLHSTSDAEELSSIDQNASLTTGSSDGHQLGGAEQARGSNITQALTPSTDILLPMSPRTLLFDSYAHDMPFFPTMDVGLSHLGYTDEMMMPETGALLDPPC